MMQPMAAEATHLTRGGGSPVVKQFSPADLLGELNEFEKKFAPPTLYLIGDEELLRQGRRISVIGSRRASADALRRARRLTRELVKHDVTVMSGLAAGVDTEAHRTAIESSGRTVAVLGTPVDTAYPKSNTVLHRVIARDHAVVSQFAQGTVTRRGNFPIRNRTMALLSDATIIVASGEKSGTIHQAWEALRIGRELAIIKSVTLTESSVIGDLIHYGASILEDENLPLWLESIHERSTCHEIPF